MKYKAYIDGLRTLAIIPVILFHAEISFFSGGFVGVDVFFVISGYLITSVIVREIEEDRFTLSMFYERRIKRILPALFVVIAITWVIFSSFAISTPYFLDISQSAVASVLFSSNMLFWKESGYFDTMSEMKPLLHTWSLAIEEQFYILYPILLMFIAKYMRRKYLPIVALLVVISFVLNVYGISRSQATTFYLLPTRAWELGFGCLVALAGERLKTSSSISNVLSILGVSLVLFSVFSFNNTIAFPGVYALLPCLGTVLIIISGLCQEKGYIIHILEKPFFVYIGKISYSLYLWHFPIFTVRRYWAAQADSFFFSDIFLLLLTFVLSIISYYFIENPIRKVRIENRKLLFSVTFCFIILFVIPGVIMHLRDGRLPWNHTVVAKDHDVLNVEPFAENSAFYVAGRTDVQPTVALTGDSHASAALSGISQIAQENGISILVDTNFGTMPIFDFQRLNDMKFNTSSEQEHFIEILEKQKNIKSVILISRWSFAYEDMLKDGSFRPFYSDNHIIHGKENIRHAFVEKLGATIKRYNHIGKKVYIFTDVPAYRYINIWYAPTCIDADDYEAEQKIFFDDLEQVRRGGAVFETVYYHRGIMVDNKYCYFIGETPIYSDDDHLSSLGSSYIANRNSDLLKNIFKN